MLSCTKGFLLLLCTRRLRTSVRPPSNRCSGLWRHRRAQIVRVRVRARARTARAGGGATGRPGCSSGVRDRRVVSRRTEGARGLDWIAVVEKRVMLALEFTSLLRTGPNSQDLTFLDQIQGSKVERFEVDMSHSIDCYNIECLSISAFVAGGVVVEGCSANSADF